MKTENKLLTIFCGILHVCNVKLHILQKEGSHCHNCLIIKSNVSDNVAHVE